MPSPFDASSGFSEDEVAKREAEQLEQLIRGRRGIVMDVIEKEWKEALDSAMETEGLMFCSTAYEGYQTNGRGCIFVNVDMGLSSNNQGHRKTAGSHVVYKSLEEVVLERSGRVKPEDHMQIIQRCQEYDPEAGFVMVFGHKGLLGVHVMRPSRPPRQVYHSRQAMGDRNDTDTLQ
ncbi:unnamed protein product [Sphacelaria rigidula]